MYHKKILVTIGILVVVIALLGVYVIHIHKPVPTEEQLIERFSEFKIQYQEKKAQGYNVSEAEESARRAKRAFDRKDYRTANKFLDSAFEALEMAEIPEVPIPTCGNQICESGENGYSCPEDCCVSGDGIGREGCTPENDDDCKPTDLSQVKVASVYQKVTDGKLINRSVDDVINLVKETKINFIFRGFWIWGPCADSCSDLPPEVLEVYEQKGFDCEKEGYSYTHLKDAVAKIKREMPDVIFCGAIPAQRINFIEINPVTSKVYNQRETNVMALDPAKWGITNVSKNQLQKYFQEHGTGGVGYFPDITHPEFQDLILGWAKKQIDSGADAIWIDGLFSQARVLEKITGNPNHPAVRESFEASSKIVDEIHRYGQSRGKHIYVGTWWAFVELPYPPPNLDFVTLTPSPEEVSSMHLDELKWDDRLEKIRDKQGDVPVFAFIDWAGTTNTPLGVFSQELSKEEQREFLKIADDFFSKKGIIFIYPVHGGFMGQDATILSFGRSKTYDSLAPEFGTYETIKQLALIKSSD